MSGSVLRGVGMQSFDDWDGEEEEFFFFYDWDGEDEESCLEFNSPSLLSRIV